MVHEGHFWVSTICLLGLGDVFAVGGGHGFGVVEDGGVKAVLVEFNPEVRGLDVHIWVKGSEVGHHALPQASCGIEGGGRATVDGGIPWLV